MRQATEYPTINLMNGEEHNRNMIDISQLKFVALPHPCWLGTLSEFGEIDVSILGDSSGADAQRIEIARQMLPHIKTFEDESKRHLDVFFKVEDPDDTWDMLSIEFGRTICDPIETFAMYFHLGMSDTYGLYFVTFHFDSKRLTSPIFPINVGRECW